MNCERHETTSLAPRWAISSFLKNPQLMLIEAQNIPKR